MVVADGDILGFHGRRLALLKEVEEAGLLPLTAADRVVLLIPTRNVETWAWCLMGNAVDESTDYKGKLADAALRSIFGKGWSPERPSEPLSLVAGRAEWARLK